VADVTDLLSTTDTPSDAELISRVRGGDAAAYGELFTRHVDSARRLSRQLVRGPDADDLVSDAFAKVLQVLQDGGGPDVAFRAYLLTAVRRLHVDRIRATSRLQTSDDMTQFDAGVPFQDTAVASFENGAAARAFASLPERWQLVLWHLEVEGQKPADIAPLLGMSANSVSALAYRAREGLRQAFLTMHLADISSDQCRWVNEHLGGFVRKGLSKRDSGKVEDHLRECRRCTAMYLELTEVNSNLRAIIAPLVLGGAAAGYLSSTGGAGAGGVLSLVGRVRVAVLANSTAATAGAVAAGVATVATAGLVITNMTGADVVTGADRPIAVTTPVVPTGAAPRSPAADLGRPKPSRPADATAGQGEAARQSSGTSADDPAGPSGAATTPAGSSAGSGVSPSGEQAAHAGAGTAGDGGSGHSVTVVPIGDGALHQPGKGSQASDASSGTPSGSSDKPGADNPGTDNPGTDKPGTDRPGSAGSPGGDRSDTGGDPPATGGDASGTTGDEPATGDTSTGGDAGGDTGNTGEDTGSEGGSTPPADGGDQTGGADQTDGGDSTGSSENTGNDGTEAPPAPPQAEDFTPSVGELSPDELDRTGNRYLVRVLLAGVEEGGTVDFTLSKVEGGPGDPSSEKRYTVDEVAPSMEYPGSLSCPTSAAGSVTVTCQVVALDDTSADVWLRLPSSGTAWLAVSYAAPDGSRWTGEPFQRSFDNGASAANTDATVATTSNVPVEHGNAPFEQTNAPTADPLARFLQT
jgi:RNA polymerase sigma factor (sigma-70 family)